MAKVVSLVVKFGALVFVLKLPAPYAIEMQLLGGIWIAQLFPAVVCGVFTRWFHPWGLLAGWAAGMAAGTGMVLALGLKSSVYPVHLLVGRVCDVCGGACVGAESGGVCGVDGGISLVKGRWRDGCDGRGDVHRLSAIS